MAVYKLGSKGEEVTKIQEELKSLGFYKGPIDGDFGGGTEAAVKAFQKSKGLDIDGKVGPNTWKVLFGSEIPKPSCHDKGLAHRCLALTGTFETGSAPPDCFCGLSGDF
ncbi:MAG TPA: peptidoglycan-binding domain-containing protein, partial [Thermodesulfobacteriota bacterium]|nr:peptidoglycan-binding domain-containing protein [Thermodesulfobacteriota bacterium]